MENIEQNPLLGPDWVPLAKALVYLNENLFGGYRASIHCYGDRFIRRNNKGGPTIKVDWLSDGSVVVFASANDKVNPPLSELQFKKLEFLGFTAPKSTSGGYALNPDEIDEESNSWFVKIYENAPSIAEVVELTLVSLVLAYGVQVEGMFYFGLHNALHEKVHALDLLERYKAHDGNPSAAIFGLKGSHPEIELYEDSSRKSSNDK
jgi:hypothetical protein